MQINLAFVCFKEIYMQIYILIELSKQMNLLNDELGEFGSFS